MEVDLSLVGGASRLSGLKYLVALRDKSARDLLDKTESSTDVDILFWPYNPLLLCTAISLSLVRDSDIGVLRTYSSGTPIPDLEEVLMNMRDVQFQDEDELTSVLELESEFVEAFIAFGTEMVMKHGKLFSGGSTYTMFDVYWGAWVAANPIFEVDLAKALGVAISIYLHEKNDVIHNTIEYYQYELNKANRKLNKLIARKTGLFGKGSIEQAAKRQYNATILLERAQRFYYWAPHEIQATGIEIEFSVSQGESIPDQFALPSHIQKRLTKRH